MADSHLQVNTNATVESRKTRLWANSVNEKETIIKSIFERDNWRVLRIENVSGSHWKIQTKCVDNYFFNINLFIGSIRDEARANDEFKMQLGSTFPVDNEVGWHTIILGIYTIDNNTGNPEYLLSGYDAEISKYDFVSNPSLRGTRTDGLQKAKIYGLYQTGSLIIFRPEFIYYYLRLVDNKFNNPNVNIERAEPVLPINPPLQQIFYGAPGTGKSKTVNDTTEQMDKENVFRVTFHPDSDYASFVGCYKPTKETVKLRDVTGKVIKETVDGAEVEVTEDRIAYKFVPQAFVNAYVQAWKNWNSATKGVTAGIGVHCPAGNNVSPYSSISITGSRTFTADYQNEATLLDTEKDLLTMIDNLQFPYGRNTCFGELRDGLKVIVTDKPTSEQLESRKITFTKEKLEELIKQIDLSKDESFVLLREINHLLEQAENGTIIHTPDLLGLYNPGEKAIYLFKENISSLCELVSTYVHEMFHAFYATENTIPEIEEPIVEASTLSFLESCKSADTQLETIFDDAKMHVQRKKYTLGIGYYGFGSYLHDNQSLDWMAQYKGNGFDRNSNLVAEYRKQFDMLYPFGQEKETMELLWNILHGVKYAMKDANSVMLVIEEINRGNCAQIFGDIFQLLDRKDGFSEYPIKPDNDLGSYLKDEFKGCNIPEDVKEGRVMLLPSNLYIWATMNTSDQSLFPIDSAFKRRWEWKYVPITDAGVGYYIECKGNKYGWYDFISKMNNEIAIKTDSEDKQMGYFFIKAEGGKITTDRFVNKVLFYLYNDVFKSYDLPTEFGNKKFTAFFTDTDTKVEELMKDLGLKALGETDTAETTEDTAE